MFFLLLYSLGILPAASYSAQKYDLELDFQYNYSSVITPITPMIILTTNTIESIAIPVSMSTPVVNTQPNKHQNQKQLHIKKSHFLIHLERILR
jgi:hypothetical protein